MNRPVFIYNNKSISVYHDPGDKSVCFKITEVSDVFTNNCRAFTNAKHVPLKSEIGMKYSELLNASKYVCMRANTDHSNQSMYLSLAGISVFVQRLRSGYQNSRDYDRVKNLNVTEDAFITFINNILKSDSIYSDKQYHHVDVINSTKDKIVYKEDIIKNEEESSIMNEKYQTKISVNTNNINWNQLIEEYRGQIFVRANSFASAITGVSNKTPFTALCTPHSSMTKELINILELLRTSKCSQRINVEGRSYVCLTMFGINVFVTRILEGGKNNPAGPKGARIRSEDEVIAYVKAFELYMNSLYPGVFTYGRVDMKSHKVIVTPSVNVPCQIPAKDTLDIPVTSDINAAVAELSIAKTSLLIPITVRGVQSNIEFSTDTEHIYLSNNGGVRFDIPKAKSHSFISELAEFIKRIGGN